MKKMSQKLFLILIFGFTVLYAETLRIMPLGDSITEGYIEDVDEGELSGYRGPLWHMLQDAGYESDFVGSQISGYDVEPPFDADHEGHYGWTCHDIAYGIYGGLMQNPAEIVLLHIGTNDMGTSTEGVSLTLDEIDRYERDSGQSVKVYVALIINRYGQNNYIRGFNEELAEVIGTRIRNGDNLSLVNMYTGAGITPDDYSDDIHPNSNGYSKMAAVWFNAIMGAETPGLYAYPYTLVDGYFIVNGSIEVDDAEGVVAFTTAIPDNGILF